MTKLLTILALLLLPRVACAQTTPVLTPYYSSSPGGTTVIPRYHDGKNFPARSLKGGVYVGSPETTGAVIVSEDYDKPQSQWQGGTTDGTTTPHSRKDIAEAFLASRVEEVTINGKAGLSANFTRNDDIEKKYDGIIMRGNGYRVTGLRAFDIAGVGGVFKRVVTGRWGSPKLWDNGSIYVDDAAADQVFGGFDFDFVDGHFNNVNVSSFRDYGVRVGHAIMYSQVHTWGGHGPGIWQYGVRCQGSQLYVESSTIGLRIDGGQNRLTQIYSHTCWDTNFIVNGNGNHLSDFEVRTEKLGIYIGGQYNMLTEGVVDMKDGDVGIQVGRNGGNGLTIDNVTLGMWGQPEAIGFQTDVTLNNCDLDFLIVGGKIGVNLVGEHGESRIGWGNTINIRRSGNDPKSKTTEVVRLPATWSATNHIYVNGTEQLPEESP